MSEEFTAKFKVDISDLKKNISEATKQIKLANSTFKAETAGMDKWSKDTDGLSKKLEQLKTVLESQKSILSSYQEQLKKQQEAYDENGKRAEQLRAKLQELANNGVSKTDAEYKKYQASLKSVIKEQQNNEKAIDELNISILEEEAAVKTTEKQIDNYSSSLNSLQQEQKEAAEQANKQKTAYESLEDTIDEQQKDLNALKSEYANVVVEQGKNSDAAQKLAGEIDELSSELQENKNKLSEADKAADELDNSLDDVGDSAEKSSGGFTVLKGALANLVADGIRLAIDAIKDFARETIEVGKQFDSSMSQVAAVSGATGDELQALRDKAKEMGENTKFSASEAADAFNYMAMAGWKTEDMLGGIEGVLNLAAAAGSDLATTSDIVTDALTAMGYSAADAGRLADVMAAASSNANTNVEMMGSTFQYAAPIIGAMGYSMEDAAVAIGLMANAGIKGDKAGTALRSTLTRLAAPPKEAADAMEALGISITNADGTMKPFSEVIGILREKFNGLSESQQAQYAKSIAGQEAMSGLLAIVNASPADFDKLTNAVNNSEGAAAKMAETMQDNLGGDLTKLGSQFEGIQLKLYEKFEPALRSGVEVLSKFGDGLKWLIDHSSEVISVLAGMAAGVAAYLAYTTAITVMTQGWMALTVVQKAVTAAQWLMNAAMSANPIGLVIAAIAALVTAFVVLWNKSEAFREFWINLWEKVKEVASEAWEKIKEWFSEAWEKIKEIWGSAKEWFSKVWEGIKNAFSNADTWFSEKFGAAWDAIKFIWDTVVSYFQMIWDNIKLVFSVVKDVLSGDFSGAWEGIKQIWQNVSNWFSERWAAIKQVFEPVTTWFSNKFGEAWKAIKDKFSGWAKYWSGLWDKVKEKFSSLGTKIGDAIGGAVKAGINKVIGLVESTINKAIGLINGAINIINAIPGVEISKVSKVSLPRLAKGGILKKGQVGLLEGSGAEAVVPLERNKQWIKAVANDLLGELKGSVKNVAPAAGNVTNSKVNNFTQNIYAPKQPSRIELYRQTRNLLAYAGEAGGV